MNANITEEDRKEETIRKVEKALKKFKEAEDDLKTADRVLIDKKIQLKAAQEDLEDACEDMGNAVAGIAKRREQLEQAMKKAKKDFEKKEMEK